MRLSWSVYFGEAMKMRHVLLATLLSFNVGSVVLAQDAETYTEDGFISGKMDINFGTRTKLDTSEDAAPGTPAEGARDTYKLALNVAKTNEYTGTITRYPERIGKVLGSVEQMAQMIFDVNIAVRNPKNLEQKKNVGKWVGSVTVDKNGAYDFGTAASGASPLRMSIDAVGKASAFVGPFTGKVYGKGSGQKGLLASKVQEYSRMVNGKKVVIKVKQSDPLRFDVTLGEGPAQVYPRTKVNGNLDYDYDTGNWLTNGIRFKYQQGGKDVEDVVTGSIKWVEDANRSENGKGQYEFNLRFNEAVVKGAPDEGAAFSGDGSEDAFFEVDDTVPAMTGTVAYVDTFAPAMSEDEEPAVTASAVTYNINVNRLSKVQAVNLFKLLMVITGPMNDE